MSVRWNQSVNLCDLADHISTYIDTHTHAHIQTHTLSNIYTGNGRRLTGHWTWLFKSAVMVLHHCKVIVHPCVRNITSVTFFSALPMCRACVVTIPGCVPIVNDGVRSSRHLRQYCVLTSSEHFDSVAESEVLATFETDCDPLDLSKAA